MSGARQAVLERIRSALVGGHTGGVDIPRDYVADRAVGTDEVLDRFVESVTEYQATVHRTTHEGLTDVIARCLGDARRVVVPADLDVAWLPDGLRVHRDRVDEPLGVDELDLQDAVVTAVAVGIADTGTVVLDGGSGQGRRVITLVPDLHVCVVAADQVVAGVPTAVRRLDPTRPQTWISGPSATSDIELDRVEGVHGPRTLHVVLLHD